MAPQFAHGVHAQPWLPRALLRRASDTRRRATRGDRAGVEGTPHADGRSRRDLGHRGAAAALAVVPQRRAGRGRAHPRRVLRDRVAQQQAGAEPGAPRHRPGALPTQRRVGVVLRDGEPGGRRLLAREGGVAARHRAGGGRRARDSAGASRPGDPGAVAHRAAGTGLRPGPRARDERVQPRQGARPARPVWLRRSGRRRLARAARRLAAADRVRHLARRDVPRAVRAVADQHERDRHPHGAQHQAMARAPEGLARRQADDVGRRLVRWPRWRCVHGAGIRSQQGAGQPRALRPAGVQRDLRAPARAARRPRTRCAARRSQAADGRLHAVQGARAPHLDRPRAAVGHWLLPQRVRARVLEVCRRRHGRARAQGQAVSGVGPRRRRLLQAALASTALHRVPAARAQGGGNAPRKVLRLLFNSAETTFDPARISDLYSRAVTMHIFEAPYRYDILARPPRVRPLTAAGMPEPSSDFRSWTIRISPGIYFADDPAFKGKRRELVAQDYVYAFQRAIDPANISPIEPSLIELKIKGLADARDAAKAAKRFDYDAPIEGLRALDRYTLRLELEQPRPRLLEAVLV